MTDAAGGSSLPDYVRGLLSPAAYPGRPEAVDLVQTHISYVFLAGDAVYKTKKPVDFGFIDQVAAEVRERLCHEEVRLNRRLTRDVYDGVVPVVRRADGTFCVERDGGGEVVEWAVKMRRLPDVATLDRRLAAGEPPPAILERLVRRLIVFHESADIVKNDPAFAGVVAERAWWTREYGEAEGFIGGTWRADDARATRAFVERSIEAEQSLFDERLVAGRVVEGHGDLQAKHVYVLGDSVGDLQIVDCIEFNDWFHFRYLDVGYDVAFLAMDLEALGFPALGDELAGRYIAASGDETMGVLQPLHRAFRAFVRGKVESIGAAAQEVPETHRRALAQSAARYFRLAAEYGGRRRGPALVLLCGLPATGKSTVAGTLAGRAGAAYVSSDIVRKRLAGLDPRERAGRPFRDGLYGPEQTERTYDELRRRAAVHLAAGRMVVVDATHSSAAHRRAAVQVAAEHDTPVLIAELRLDDDAVRARFDAREHDPLRTTDATWELYERQREAFEPVTPGEAPHLLLDASQSPLELVQQIAAELPSAG